MGHSCRGWDNGECEGTPYCPPRCPRYVDGDGDAYVLRPYRPSDRSSLVDMYLQMDTDSRTLGLPPVTERRIQDWLDGLTRDGWSLVANRDDRIVGHVGVTPASESEPHLVVFVHQDWRNRGIGSQLLRQMIAYADEWGHDGLALTVTGDNRRAIAIYDNLGFDVVGRLRTEIEMSLSLDEPIADRVKRPPIAWGDEE